MNDKIIQKYLDPLNTILEKHFIKIASSSKVNQDGSITMCVRFFMEIFILYGWHNYSDQSIYGVYSSKEKVIEVINSNLENYNAYAIEKGNHNAEYFYEYKVETRILDEI